ncbi:hypothetical protein [Bacillus mycoides]|uniref:hypothetical protein n=1 Tax=Bacillus mycoides TaxID=1405 RepID=UPI002E2319A7|nr:hypothetical protein [Bacillus mycoides]
MKTNNEKFLAKMKEEAIYRLEKLGIDKNVIEIMKSSNDAIFVSEVFNVEYVGLVSKIVEYKVDDLPEQAKTAMRNCLPYFGINYQGGLCLFYVSSYEDEWEFDRDYLDDKNPIVYVYNELHPDHSEFGGIWFEKTPQGLIRSG